MTVSNTTSTVTGYGNGVNTLWNYTFKIPDADSVVVTLIDASGVETPISAGNYSITGLGVDGGGTVTYPLTGSPIATGYSLRIDRTSQLTQNSSFSSQRGNINPIIEAAVDKLTFIAQEVRRDTNRVLASVAAIATSVATAAAYAASATASAAAAAASAAAAALFDPANYYLKTDFKADGSGNAPALYRATGSFLAKGFITEGAAKGINWTTSNVSRFSLLASTADMLSLITYDNAGSAIGSVIDVDRATRVGAFAVSPTVPTATSGDSSQKAANTAFVQDEVAKVGFSGARSVEMTLSGASAVDLTGIPSTARRVTLAISAASVAATAVLGLQLRTGGAAQTTGYVSQVNSGAGIGQATDRFLLNNNIATAALAFGGLVTLVRQTSNTWVLYSGNTPDSASYGSARAEGWCVLTGTIDGLRLLLSTSTFDAGVATAYWE